MSNYKSIADVHEAFYTLDRGKAAVSMNWSGASVSAKDSYENNKEVLELARFIFSQDYVDMVLKKKVQS